MWFRSFAALGSLAIVIAAAAAAASASEIKVLSIPFNGPIDGIGPQFERSTGHKLVVKYAPSAPLQKQIDAGEPFDVVLIFPGIVDQLIKQGKVIAGTRADIARAGLGVAIRKGAAKPDLRTTEAFKQMLLASTSIAYAAQGPSGVHFIDLLNRFGIAQDLKPKLKPMGAGSLVVGPVARGEAEIGYCLDSVHRRGRRRRTGRRAPARTAGLRSLFSRDRCLRPGQECGRRIHQAFQPSGIPQSFDSQRIGGR